ncbi:MAG: TetR/AcrR family transcriptional regulator [Oscillospiraceae bacterium]
MRQEDTKGRILSAALELFSKRGYEAVTVEQIAHTVGIKAPSLYKHFKSKRDIFDSIVCRMEQTDALRAREFGLPDAAPDEMAEEYRQASMRQLIEFSKAQFTYWTEDDFSSNFRKLLTLEQYRDPDMQKLYQQYLSAGPLSYVADLFKSWQIDAPEQKAAEFFAPMFLMYSLYDGGIAKETLEQALNAHFDGFRL